jgi:lipoate-protein ligase A
MPQSAIRNRMLLLPLTLSAPAENLALDEALVEAADVGELAGEVLRLWESPETIAVIGRSSRVADEINLPACRAAKIPVVRRASGGAAIVAGRGCLMYSVVLRYAGREHLRMLDNLHRHVLGTLRQALCPLVAGIEHVGTSDLAIAGRKFSGNSVRAKRDHLLYHGTILYDFELPLVGRLLGTPPRQPEYRAGRSHGEFLMNLHVSPVDLMQSIAAAFDATELLEAWPRRRTEQLAQERYSSERWNFER